MNTTDCYSYKSKDYAAFSKLLYYNSAKYSVEVSDSNEKEEKEVVTAFEEPMAKLLCIFLTDCCDQIHILGGFERLNLIQAKTEPKELATRVGEFHLNEPVYDADTSEIFLKAYNKRKFMKLTNDSLFVKNILLLLKTEIKYEYNYTVLTDLLTDIKDIHFEETSLLQEKLTNLQNMINLKTVLDNEEQESLLKLQELDEEISNMRNITEDIGFVNTIRTRYISNWESARTNQNLTVHHQSENELRNTISNYKLEIDKELRITMEISEFLDKNQKEITASIDYWSTLYDKELERREIEMQLLRDKREVQENDYFELKGLFALHKYKIDEYLTYKENKRIDDERNALFYAKAVIIQAWWRGLMVRLKLGHFNPNWKKRRGRKKPPTDKKDDKKGKKKK